MKNVSFATLSRRTFILSIYYKKKVSENEANNKNSTISVCVCVRFKAKFSSSQENRPKIQWYIDFFFQKTFPTRKIYNFSKEKKAEFSPSSQLKKKTERTEKFSLDSKKKEFVNFRVRFSFFFRSTQFYRSDDTSSENFPFFDFLFSCHDIRISRIKCIFRPLV